MRFNLRSLKLQIQLRLRPGDIILEIQAQLKMTHIYRPRKIERLPCRTGKVYQSV